MTIFGALMGFLLLSGVASVTPTAPEVPQAPAGPRLEVAMTAYNAVPGQTDEDPFTTASGAYSNPEVVAARSRDLAEELPFGTVIAIEGPEDSQHGCGFEVVSPLLGYRVIADTMNARYTNRIDVLFDTDANYILSNGKSINASNIMGVCKGVTVRVVGRLDPKRMHKLPKTQEELVEAVIAMQAGVATRPIALK